MDEMPDCTATFLNEGVSDHSPIRVREKGKNNKQEGIQILQHVAFK